MTTSASVSTIGSRARVESAVLRLWSPDHIFLITFALGAPGGIALLAINLYRIRMLNKVPLPAFIAVSTALLTPVLYHLLIAVLPSPFSTIAVLSCNLIVGLVMAGYLTSVTQKQIEQSQSAAPDREIQNRGWLLGIGIAFASLATYLVIAFGIAVVLAMFGIYSA